MSSEPLTETEDFLTERSAYSSTSDVARLRQVSLYCVWSACHEPMLTLLPRQALSLAVGSVQAYQNERNAPEILQYQDALVGRIESLIADRVRCVVVST